MKKILFLILFAAGIITAAMLNLRMNTQSKSSSIVSYNREALASGTGNTVDCYSSSTNSPNNDYYDCGPCEKVSGRKGTGTKRTCTYNPPAQ
ncbi:MAG: hypothetical protein LBK58_07035 [Prevotellaceae bacterium]|jgi:hypothetical protein|nr:hypothetical protein [Prevotellaceae bacterium]